MKGLCILLVEDDDMDAKAVRRAFAAAQVPNDLRCVQNGHQALAFLRRSSPEYADTQTAPRPDLILLDMNMPIMGGIELLQELRKDEALRHIPVVALTSANEQVVRQRAFNAGVAGYFLKPNEFSSYVSICQTVGQYWNLSALPSAVNAQH